MAIQIEQLSRAVQLSPEDSDLQLLLGYQLLGTDKLESAAGHLDSAALDSNNRQAATLLKNLLNKLNGSATDDPDSKDTPTDGSSKAQPPGKSDGANFRTFAMAANNWLAVE